MLKIVKKTTDCKYLTVFYEVLYFDKLFNYHKLLNCMKKIIIPLLVSASLMACATRPESISASYISHEKYMGQDCTQLGLSMGEARNQLSKFSSMQDSKANMDAATVFFVLIPASKLSGDHAGDVAKFKGEVEAIETALIKTACKKAG